MVTEKYKSVETEVQRIKLLYYLPHGRTKHLTNNQYFIVAIRCTAWPRLFCLRTNQNSKN